MGNKNSPPRNTIVINLPSNNTPPIHTDTNILPSDMNNQPSSSLELAYKKWKKIIINYDTAHDANHDFPSDKTFKAFIKATIDFSNGFIWTISAIETETEYSLINVLVDSIGKEILNLSYESYTQLSPVEKGVFTYVDSKDNFAYSYTIKSNRIEKIKEYEFQFEELTEDLGYKHKDGSQIIYDIDTFEILGIQLKNGRKFYLKSTN